MDVKAINVNGKIFKCGENEWDDIQVYPPTNNYPYWEIDLYTGDQVTLKIQATGDVTVFLKGANDEN